MATLQFLTLLAALAVIAVIALAALAIEAGPKLTAPQARVLRAAIAAVQHLMIAYGSALATQDAPHTQIMTGLMPLLQ
ncbi:hypothetical protein ABZW47_31380 [Streptomyces sp. NPDC004549]|uniref:hypothetical protein n=1 Tax=Streptomyces sp. NPDC004549 TaxID=3154283 RepID=UPI0033A25351